MWCYPAIHFDGVVVYGNAPVILRSRFKSMHPNCPDRPGDTVYINAKRGCDTTPVKSPVHDTALCAGDTLWFHVPDSSLFGYKLEWKNLSALQATGEVIVYNADNPFPFRDTGVYAYSAKSLLNNGCPVREGDTIHVSYWPKPESFLPRDTIVACGGANGAPVFTLNQSGIHVFWSDSSTNPIYKFAYKGDTLEKRYAFLSNACGDSLTDSVVVHFLPPYAYLGGDSIIGCKGDTLLFDVGQWNRHLPNCDSLRYVWTLRGDTVLLGRLVDSMNLNQPCADPTKLQLVLPQDTGLLIVRVQAVLSDESDGDCPAATDTIDLQLYPWPDIDFYVRAGDTTICYYDSIELFLDRDSLVFSPDAYYIWLFDSVPYDTTADEIFYAADSGLYTVTGVNYCSRHSESFFLHHHPVERITVTLTDTTVCPDISVSIDPTLTNYPSNRYVWFKSGGEGGGEGGDEGGGTYVTPRPNVRFSQFKNPDKEPDNDNYNEWPWDYSAALWVDTPGGYVLYIRDTAGCMARYEYNVKVEDCTPQVEAPNVFTPNGDGINDEFTLKTMEKLFNFEISIFNRWGQQVKSFKGEPKDFSWDGRFNSSLEAPDGVYFYFISYENYKGKKKKLSGAVTILR